MPVDEEEFRYPALVNRWQAERGTTALTRMDGAFYDHFDKHLRTLVGEYQKEHALNPTTPKVLILQDELRNLQRVRDDFYDLREKKIVTAALIAARGGNPDRTNLTKEEELLFDGLLRVLRDARRNLLLRGQPAKELPKPSGGPPAPPEESARASTPSAQPVSVLEQAAAPPGGESRLPGAPEPAPRHAPAPEALRASEDEPRRMGPPRSLVRVLAPVDPFVGSDMREYRLTPEDVVALPKEFAAALVGRGLARALGS